MNYERGFFMKKMIISFIAAVTAIVSTVTCVTCFATLNYRDPNGDGIISISDQLYISQYLSGKFEPDGYYIEPMDFNENSVVSILDAELVGVVDSGGNFIKGNAGNANTTTYLGDNNDVDYRVYNAVTGAYISGHDYTLSPTDVYNPNNGLEQGELLSGGSSPDGINTIIGQDTRVIDWTKNGVVKLMISEDPYYTGTGFVVGENTILTAAHCVIDDNSAIVLSGIKLFDANGINTLTVNPVEIHVPEDYFSNNSYISDTHDYALITVGTDISSYMCFDLGVAVDYDSAVTVPLTVTGFPQNLPNSNYTNNNTNHVMYSGVGTLTSSTSRRLYYNTDTSSGNSGSPVYITESSNGYVHNTVVAIHTTTNGVANCGVRINSEILRFVHRNLYI